MNVQQILVLAEQYVAMNRENSAANVLLDMRVNPTEMVVVKWLLLPQDVVPLTRVEMEKSVFVKEMP